MSTLPPEPKPAGPSRSPIAMVVSSCKKALVALASISGLINLLMLTGSLFMMQIYDRVLGSQSIPTLAVLSLIAIAAFVFQGGLELVRSRVLSLIGERIDEEVAPKVHAAVAELPLRMQRGAGEVMQPFRDLETLRTYVGGAGPVAFFDMPWTPIYLVVLFLLHWSCGALTIAGGLVLIALTWAAEVRGRGPTREMIEAQSARNLAADATQRNAEVVYALGLMPALSSRWQSLHNQYLAAQRRSSFATGGLATASRVFRMVLQSAMLGLGAYLAIRGQISAGAIIAASILGGRALAPIDQAIGAWKLFVAARQGYDRLTKLLTIFPDRVIPFALPAPSRLLTVESLSVAPPGSREPTVKRASFSLSAGQALGIIGPSASGKSTLVRGIVGVWQPLVGKVMLDGATLDQWAPAALGPSIGYLPQDVQLFDGTVAENVARFSPDALPAAVIAAARLAGFHDQIVTLPAGYDTRIGHGGTHLSAGQRQKLGLARALFGDPFLVVLDEPNANLDAEGEAAVVEAIRAVKARGGIAVVVAHRPSAVAAVDLIAAMKSGEIIAFGPRDEIFARTLQNARNVIQHPAARTEPMRSDGAD